MTSSVTGGDGPVGGHEMRKARILLQSSALYIDEERLGRSTKLHNKKKKMLNKYATKTMQAKWKQYEYVQ